MNFVFLSCRRRSHCEWNTSPAAEGERHEGTEEDTAPAVQGEDSHGWHHTCAGHTGGHR